MSVLKKNKTIAGILAIFTGTIGLHRFYMGEYKIGLIYLLFFWTGVPTILGIIDGARLLTQVAEESEDDITDNKEMLEDEDKEITKEFTEEKDDE